MTGQLRGDEEHVRGWDLVYDAGYIEIDPAHCGYTTFLGCAVPPSPYEKSRGRYSIGKNGKIVFDRDSLGQGQGEEDGKGEGEEESVAPPMVSQSSEIDDEAVLTSRDDNIHVPLQAQAQTIKRSRSNEPSITAAAAAAAAAAATATRRSSTADHTTSTAYISSASSSGRGPSLTTDQRGASLPVFPSSSSPASFRASQEPSLPPRRDSYMMKSDSHPSPSFSSSTSATLTATGAVRENRRLSTTSTGAVDYELSHLDSSSRSPSRSFTGPNGDRYPSLSASYSDSITASPRPTSASHITANAGRNVIYDHSSYSAAYKGIPSTSKSYDSNAALNSSQNRLKSDSNEGHNSDPSSGTSTERLLATSGRYVSGINALLDKLALD